MVPEASDIADDDVALDSVAVLLTLLVLLLVLLSAEGAKL